MTEARLAEDEHGALTAQDDGWFVLNARAARWHRGDFGRLCSFEGVTGFPQVGINLKILLPGEPRSLYHRENAQEDFLVLEGECLLVVEGEERPLRRWDFVHLPAGVDHVFIGAGDGPSLLLSVGARVEPEEIVYPVDPVAQRHGAGVDVETPDPEVAYAQYSSAQVRYEEGWLPG